MWTLGRAIDYHERNPWYVIWAALSPQDELFIYRNRTFDLNKWVNSTIAEEIVRLSGRERFVCNLIDPLANKKQPNTGRTVVEDLNRVCYRLRQTGAGTGGYWEPYDTRGTVGRDNIRERLRNSLSVGRPFNNACSEKGYIKHLSTLWILKNCKDVATAMRQWRYEDWTSSKVLVTKERKETPSQKFSHYLTALEGLLKDNRFRARKKMSHRRIVRPSYFKKDRG